VTEPFPGAALGGPGFGGPGFGPATGPRNRLGIAALVLGIAAAVLSVTVLGGIVLGVPALILGLKGRARARRGEATNGGVAVAGVVTGIIALLLSVALVVVGVIVLNTNAGQTYRSCLRQAGSDRAAISACGRQFDKQLRGEAAGPGLAGRPLRGLGR
jgi:hypothetical protein